MLVSLRRLGARFCRDRRGASAIEMGLVAAPFLGFIIASLQTGLVYFADSALEIATEKTSRLVLTGNTQTQTQQQFLTTLCSKLPSLLSCANVMVDAQVYSSFSSANTSTPTITYNPNGTVSNQWSYNTGGARSIVVLRVLYLLPVVGGPLAFNLANAGHGKHLCMATAVFKNEPYQ